MAHQPRYFHTLYVLDFCEINPDSPFFASAADLFSALSNVAGQ